MAGDSNSAFLNDVFRGRRPLASPRSDALESSIVLSPIPLDGMAEWALAGAATRRAGAVAKRQQVIDSVADALVGGIPALRRRQFQNAISAGARGLGINASKISRSAKRDWTELAANAGSYDGSARMAFARQAVNSLLR